MQDADPFGGLHEGLPRQGPGSESTTRILFGSIKQPDKIKRAIDMGCGTGRSAVWLAQQGIDVAAIDKNQPFLEELREAATQAGVADRLDIQNMSIDAVPYKDKSFDLVWSEGSAYFMGWKRALTYWKRLIKPGGYLIATDLFWVTDNPSAELADFFKDDKVLTLEQGAQIARQSGFSVIKTYIQPDSDWFDEYYNPLEEKVQALSGNNDETIRSAIDKVKHEIAIRRKYATEYEHVGFILQTS